MVRAIKYTAPLKDVNDYIVFDTETTGVDPKNDKIIEVGLLEVKGNQIVDRFGSFVNPGRPIPIEASNVNHIFDSDVTDAPTEAEIAPTLARWLLGKTVVAHNARFDTELVVSLLNAAGYTGIIRYIDTLFYARQTIKGVDNYKLQTLAGYLEIDPGDAHRAVDDTVTCHLLFQRCKELSSDALLSQKPVSIDTSDFVRARDVSPSGPISPGCPLYYKRVVFTGSFVRARRELMQMAADAGAILQDRVTYETDYLVEGTQDTAVVGPSGRSQKQIRAEEINKSGERHVEIIKEEELIRLCQRKAVSDTMPSAQGDQAAKSSSSVVWTVIQWIIAAAFTIISLALATKYPLSAVLLFLIAVLSLPVRGLRAALAKIHIKGYIILIIAIVLFIIAVLV